MEKYIDGRKELHCVFVYLVIAHANAPRGEAWHCMRKSRVAEKYMITVQ